MKIYTRGGDDGTTSLATGERVPKNDSRVDLYGDVDELNSCIGAALAFLNSEKARNLKTFLEKEQSLLFELGAELAGWSSGKEGAILPEDIAALESEIDGMESELSPLKNFILPGGSPTGALLHRARTICRRVERKMVAQGQNVARESIQYINRLSDLLFVAARYANYLEGVPEQSWSSRRRTGSK